MRTFAFIDASNIIYGTRDEGWKVDFKKLFKYLKERYKCKKIYYFAGLDEKNKKQLNFYHKLKSFGYDLILKQIKLYKGENGRVVRKANCDVDLTFYAMRDLKKYNRSIFLSGDGDFKILFEYLVKQKVIVHIFANYKRTAVEIKKMSGITFNDLASLRKVLEYKNRR